MALSQEEIDNIAKKFIELKNNAEKTRSKKIKAQFKAYQNYCVEKLRFLVTNRAGRYRKFSNHPDLEQDGFEALILALKTYNPSKGAFSWWADKYISTRISRAANAHSTIRFPIKKAREMKPYKTSELPIMIDAGLDASLIFENNETANILSTAIKQLPEKHQKIINLIYGFHGSKEQSLESAAKELAMSRAQSAKLLEEAKQKLKEILRSEI
jgi:RNA polymerase sigma factor (sigma-70 family)